MLNASARCHQCPPFASGAHHLPLASGPHLLLLQPFTSDAHHSPPPPSVPTACSSTHHLPLPSTICFCHLPLDSSTHHLPLALNNCNLWFCCWQVVLTTCIWQPPLASAAICVCCPPLPSAQMPTACLQQPPFAYATLHLPPPPATQLLHSPFA